MNRGEVKLHSKSIGVRVRLELELCRWVMEAALLGVRLRGLLWGRA